MMCTAALAARLKENHQGKSRSQCFARVLALSRAGGKLATCASIASSYAGLKPDAV